MKRTIVIISCLILCLFFADCKKCVTCTKTCETATVSDSGGQVVSKSSACGSDSLIQSFEAGTQVVYASQFSVVFVKTAQYKNKVCNSGAEADSSISHYKADGFGCW